MLALPLITEIICRGPKESSCFNSIS